jgi:hypothetical protein
VQYLWKRYKGDNYLLETNICHGKAAELISDKGINRKGERVPGIGLYRCSLCHRSFYAPLPVGDRGGG